MAFKKQTIIVVIIGVLAVAPFFVHAAGLVPCGGPTEKPCTVLDAFYGVARVTNWLVMVAGLYAVFKLVQAGFWLTISAGNEENITKWKKTGTDAIIGFFIVMAAYMFVNTAVNILLMSKCKIDFASPWTYVTLTNPNSYTCAANSYNVEGGIVPGGQ